MRAQPTAPARKLVTLTYDRSRQALDYTLYGLNASFSALWLGLLDPAQLHEVDRSYYDRMRHYGQDDYNLSGLSPWEAKVIDAHFGDARTLLLVGAGGGREAIALHRRGFAVCAFECHDQLRHQANALFAQEGIPLTVHPARRDHCPAPDRLCDGGIIGWGAYMLVQGRARRVNLLREMRAHLPGGAPLLLSFFHRPERGRSVTLLALTATIASALRRLRGAEAAELGDFLAPNYVHYFSRSELTRELQDGGFSLAHWDTAGYGHAVALAA